MQRYFIQLAYKGTNYHGWQIQPNAVSVQGTLTKAVSLICRENVNIVGAGRTDTGVHASFFVAHFDREKPLSDPDQLAFMLNRFLPADIRIDKIFAVGTGAHARFSALSRTYCYYYTNRKQPFKDEFCTFIPFTPDIEKMNEAANTLFDYTDFTSFSKLHSDTKTNNCKIMKALWKQQDDLLVFEIKADRFLRNMVRAIVGTLMEVGLKNLSIENFRKIIESKNRGKAGESVKSKGLFLTNIEYPEKINRLLVR